MKKIARLRLSPYSPSPSPPLPPSSNLVYGDMIEIVENDVGKLVCSYTTSRILLEGEGGGMKTVFHCHQEFWYDLTMSLNIFCKGL